MLEAAGKAPGAASQEQSERHARRQYVWLWLSSFSTVPGMFMLMIGQSYGQYYGPSWSPDGSQIVYVNRGIWAMDASGFHQTQLVEERYANCPSWSPDGSRIAYVDGGVYVMDSDGAILTRLMVGER